MLASIFYSIGNYRKQGPGRSAEASNLYEDQGSMLLREIGETGLTKMPFTMYLWGGRAYQISQSTNLFTYQSILKPIFYLSKIIISCKSTELRFRCLLSGTVNCLSRHRP